MFQALTRAAAETRNELGGYAKKAISNYAFYVVAGLVFLVAFIFVLLASFWV
jgi:hypothetical protein